MATRVVTSHLPEELAEKLDHYAARQDRSRGWIVRRAVSDWIAREEDRDAMTREALADVAAGRVVPHEEVVEWALSLGTENELPRPRPK